MTKKEAKKNIDLYYTKQYPNIEDEKLYIESLKYLIDALKDENAMIELASFYYAKDEYELMLKYYNLAALNNNNRANEALGYIYYNGLIGVTNYELAYRYYHSAMKNNRINASYMIADMYYNGYYINKDYDKYKEIIEDIYNNKNKYIDDNYDYYIPEIYSRMARIRINQHRTSEAISLIKMAKSNLKDRMLWDDSYENFNIMKQLIQDLYNISAINYKNIDLYDLYEILDDESLVKLEYDDVVYNIVSVKKLYGTIEIHFNKKWYNDIDDFMHNANINGKKLIFLVNDIDIININPIDTKTITFIN